MVTKHKTTILKDDEWVKEILGCLREEKKTNDHNEKLKLKAAEKAKENGQEPPKEEWKVL